MATKKKLPKGISLLDSGRYQLRIREGGRGSKEIKSTWDTAQEAIEEQNRIKADKSRAGGRVNLVGAKAKVGDFVREHYSARPADAIADSTRTTYTALIDSWIDPTPDRRYDPDHRKVRFISGLAMNAVTPDHVRAWLRDLTDVAELSPSTVRQIRVITQRPFRVAHAEGLITRNPFATVEAGRSKRKPRASTDQSPALSPAEVAAIAEAIDPRYRNLVWATALTGARISEVVAFTEDRVGERDGTGSLTVDRQLGPNAERTPDGTLGFTATKTGTSRTFAIGWVLDRIVAQQVEAGTGEEGLLFTNRNGDRVNPNQIRQRAWATAVDKALTADRVAELVGPDRSLGFHALRHANASWMFEMKVEARTRHERLGHELTALGTSDAVYAHTSWPLHVEAAEKLEAHVAEWWPADLAEALDVGTDNLAEVIEHPKVADLITEIEALHARLAELESIGVEAAS